MTARNGIDQFLLRGFHQGFHLNVRALRQQSFRIGMENASQQYFRHLFLALSRLVQADGQIRRVHTDRVQSGNGLQHGYRCLITDQDVL